MAAPPIPTTEPQIIFAGDTVKWNLDIPGYPATDGWTLTYRLINASGKIDIGGGQITTTGGTFNIVLPATTTAAYVAGDYTWNCYVTDASGNRVTVKPGVITVKTNLAAQSSAFDTRSDVKKILDSLDALIAGRATADVEEYQIGGRRIKKMQIAELLKWRSVYAAKYKAERIAAGETFPSTSIGVRFGNAN